MTHIAVIGAGQAGASLVAKLRSEGFEGDITLIGAEAVPPYQRPPLSKAYLLGDMTLERLFLRPQSFYYENNIALRLSTQVTAIDTSAKTIAIGDELLSYDQLALTTGPFRASCLRRPVARLAASIPCAISRTLTRWPPM